MSNVLVTGCSSGFGEAIALAFAHRGDRVIATMRRPEAAPPSLRSLHDAGTGQVVIATLDVTDGSMRSQAIELATRLFGGLDVLVNNAGITATGSMEDTPEKVWRSIFETNFFGPLELIRLALPIMRQQGTGRIINVTSVAALLATPLLSAYSAAKHAMDAASSSLDIETRSYGVRVTTVMPGPFKTRLPVSSLQLGPSAPYEKITTSFKAVFGELEQRAPEDLSPVVQATLAAAFDTDPKLRYTAGTDALRLLPPILQALEPLQRFGMHVTGQDGAAH